MDLNKIYNQLTNIDIKEQQQIWDDRGKGYFGEYLLFCELYRKITGNGKILMNLNVPVGNGKTTEIDLLLIHETGLYVFEIKHYKGTIYGKATDKIWTQYFRTVKNSSFKNPVLQNQYHINALKQHYPSLPIHSFIVFTADDCVLKVDNSNPDMEICCLRDVYSLLRLCFYKCAPILTMDKIDQIFRSLSQFSSMQEPVSIDGCEKTFQAWVQPIIAKLEEKKEEVIKEKEALKKQKTIGIISNIFIAVGCIIICILVTLGIKAGYDHALERNNQELQTFKQNFSHVDEVENEYTSSLNPYISVSDVKITKSADHVSLNTRLHILTNDYGIVLQKNSKYIVMTTSGKVYEYDVFGKHLSYNPIANTLGKGYRQYGDLAEAQFYGINQASDISYVKLTNVQLFKIDINKTVVKDNLELELYSNKK